jgi:MFS family permease
LPEYADNFDRLNPGVWKAVSVAVLGSFLSQLDATVVNVSLGSLAVELHSSLQAIQWVTSGYLLALALMLPLNGWLVERIGTKRLYLICFSSFTLSSVLCALSWSADSLIGFRVLQGISGGLMAPLTQLMIARAAGKHMVRVMGYVAVPVLLGPIVAQLSRVRFCSMRPGVGFSLSTCRSVCWRLYSPPFFFLRMTTEHDLKEVLIWWVF